MAAVAVGLPPPSAMSNQHSTLAADGQRAELPRPYKCPLCDKAFHRLEHQTRHIRTHTGEKPHACNFPGCSKRFSRSDELTRHSRIHSNPNSRRGRASHGVANSSATSAALGGSLPDNHSLANVMGPPSISWSNPGSAAPSPNVSPPQSYHRYHSNASTPYTSYNHSPEQYAHGPSPKGPGNMNLLATAASQAAREHELSSVPLPLRRHGASPYSSHPQGYREPYYTPHSNSRLAPMEGHGISQPMSKSLSTEGRDHYMHRISKRSRPGSPFSTGPPSPSFSASNSPPSRNTPAMTPGQSPRLHPYDGPHDTHLPGIRHLSLQHMQSPLLEPLEPTAEANGGMPKGVQPYSRSQNSSSSGLRISDIVNKEDGAQRKLPMPAPTLQREGSGASGDFIMDRP